MESKYSKAQISKYIEDLIDKSEKTAIFPNKCRNLSSMLRNIRDCITEFPNEINPNNLEKLGKYLKDIYKIVDNLQTKDNFWTYLQSNNAILDIVSDINKKMVKINKLLNVIDCKGSFTLPSDDLSQDLGEIDDLLSSTLRMITERRPELSNDIKQNKKTIMKDENESSEDMAEIIKKYQYYRIKQSDFEYVDRKSLYSNKVFSYFKGRMKKDKQNATILELNEEYFSIFDRLISVLIIIDHPYIESFKGFYANDSEIKIITNRDGDPLSDLIYKKSDLKSGDLTILAFKIAEAMAYLHSKSIIHRNLSTSNIYVTRTEEGLNPSVVGFRNSRFFPDKKESFCTEINFDYKIPISFFRAPEFEEKGIYDEKVDVFAFSGILYELLVGKVPFYDVDDRKTVVDLIQKEKRPSLPDDLPIEFKSLIESCWDHDATKRPSFSQICSTMIEKRIILPFDEDSKEKINQFYDRCKNKKLTKDDCIKTIENIKYYISKVFQFTYEFEEIRKVLHTYQDKLNIPSYFYNKGKIKIDFKNQNKITNLYNNLMELQKIVFDNNEDQFCSYLDSFKDKKLGSLKTEDSLVDFKPYQTPSKIEESMRKIYNSMKELGFNNVDEYKTNSEDLAHDLQSISFLLVDFQKYAGSSIVDSQIEDIKKLRKEKKLDENISKEIQYNRLNDLLSQYRKVNRNDFEIKKTIADDGTIKIYKGIRKFKNKPVLIKEILNTSNLLNLQTEITNLTRVKHKSVATFIGYNLSETDNSVWFITKNYTTKTLYDAIDENQMSGNDMTEIAFNIAKGMEYITSKSLMHHDLNTKTIVMEENKNPKIMRFNYQLNL